MALKDRAIDARLRGIEKALQRADNRRDWANGQESGGNWHAAGVAAAEYEKIRRLIKQAASLQPVSRIGLAAKARIVGRHLDVPVVGRVVLRSLVENLHALEHDRRR